MNDARQDLIHIQELVGTAFSATGSLVALTDGEQMNPNKLQKTLEQTMDYFERSTLELRQLCERYSPGVGGFAHKPMLPAADVAGSVEEFGYGWLHIMLHTLLPHEHDLLVVLVEQAIHRGAVQYKLSGAVFCFAVPQLIICLNG